MTLPGSPPRRSGTLPGSIAAAAFALLLAPAWAGDGKLLLTGGVSSIDGAAGGGLTPWAVTAGYASPGQRAVTASLTRLDTQDYGLSVEGITASLGERLELSIAHQDFATRATGAALGLPGLHLRQNIFGAKVLLAGDAILDSDSPMPAVALGIEVKRLDAGALAPTLAALGAADHGIDVYLSATKLFLAQSVLVNVGVRGTKANQNGLLGFGGVASEHVSLEPEISLAWLLRRDLAIGVEYRAKPDKLDPSALGAGLREDDWKDLFVAWAPTKHVSLTLACVDLGRIVPAVQSRRQTGAYASLQLAY
jgi:hypothetical protein